MPPLPSEEPPHILVVDDDFRLRELLSQYLTPKGFHVTTAKDAATARQLLATLSFDLIVLDVMMPGESGVAFTRDWRKNSSVPILLLTARGEISQRIEGLESGADDYLVKPFEPRELLLRIAAILKRAAQPPEKPGPSQIRLGELVFEIERQSLRSARDFIHLTPAETALLAVFAARPGVPLTRDDLLAAGISPGQGRTIDVQVTRLRRKIEPDPKYPRYLQTVRGKGYLLQPD
jgi:two-component system phosphate regulon response regulator OmpR